MSTDIVFDKAQLNTNEHGVFLCIKLPLESRQKARDFVLNLKSEKKYVAKLCERKEKRSLDQNGYFWVLCNQLSAVLKIPPDALYKEYIKDIGGNFEITPIKAEAVKRWIEIWEGKGIGFIAEDLGESKIEGYHNVRNYFGSSTYDTAQMSRLLDLIIADCDENGIVTLEKEEIERMAQNVVGR
ncbi:MAG: hypothetical protein J6Q10_00090 [Clostridia bacterium]|nr:hypothetical protein [Clostridia bacterium]